MDNRKSTNIAFIILILLLFVAALKAQKTPTALQDVVGLGQNMPQMPGMNYKPVEKDAEPQIILRDFDTIQQPKRVKRTIDRATAMKYIKVRPLNGTEMLALTKVKKISEHMNKNRKVIIYVDRGSEREIQAFIKEFSKSREKYRYNPNFVFIPLETLWDLDDDTIRNTHDRVVYNLKQDCGLFCILDLKGERLIRLKGSAVSKKSAEIIGVILQSL